MKPTVGLRPIAKAWEQKKRLKQGFKRSFGGKRGIRTPGRVTPTSHFECDTFDHSAIFPFHYDAAKVSNILETAKYFWKFFLQK